MTKTMNTIANTLAGYGHETTDDGASLVLDGTSFTVRREALTVSLFHEGSAVASFRPSKLDAETIGHLLNATIGAFSGSEQ